MRRIALAAAIAAALFSPTPVDARGGSRGGGHSTGNSVAVVAGGHHHHFSRHSFAVGGIAGGRSASPKAWTAAPALVAVAAPALRSVSTTSYCVSCARDSHGHIARSEAAKDQFMANTGYPHGRPGYVVDHVIPLKRGGADSPSNMQWQTKADAAAKDKVE